MNKIIKELEEKIKELENLAYYDELTKLLNRRGFFNKTEKIFQAIIFRRKERERRIGYNIPLAIIFADIDNFKKINDTYGHEGGDFVLKKVANCFKKRLRTYDIISRLGGEEFIIALLGADLEAAKIVAEDLRKIVEKTPFMFRGKKIPVTLSLGVAVYSKENKIKDLIEKADKAMYEAKKTGKNKVVVYKEN